jgi:DNA-binding response OmpR family regulator
MQKKILIVEDDSFLQGLASSKLEKDGFMVTGASNSDEAAKVLDGETPDLILLDLVLPGTDGYGILKKLREGVKTKDTPVIVFSNLSDDSDIKKAKELGATDYMVKSNFTLDELSDRIKELLK